VSNFYNKNDKNYFNDNNMFDSYLKKLKYLNRKEFSHLIININYHVYILLTLYIFNILLLYPYYYILIRASWLLDHKLEVRRLLSLSDEVRGLVSVGYRDYWSVCSIVGASQHGWPYSHCALPGALVPSCAKRATGQYLQTFGTCHENELRKT